MTVIQGDKETAEMETQKIKGVLAKARLNDALRTLEALFVLAETNTGLGAPRVQTLSYVPFVRLAWEAIHTILDVDASALPSWLTAEWSFYGRCGLHAYGNRIPA